MKLFRKPKSKFYWYDFTVRGSRYRGSTHETKSVRALQVPSLKLASVMENTDPLPSKPAVLQDFAVRFFDWVDNSRLEEKIRKFYRNGWRLLKGTSAAVLRIDQITGDCADQLQFPGSAANANCALRTLRRMLHKAEEWKMIGHAPKIKMMKEHGRHLRLDDEAGKQTDNGSTGLQLAATNSRTFPGHRHLDARHGHAERKRTLPDAYRELGLAKPCNLCARQQDRRRATACSNECASLRNSAQQMRCEIGGLGISVKALQIRTSDVNLQSLSKSS